jgi:hypothetical protein
VVVLALLFALAIATMFVMMLPNRLAMAMPMAILYLVVAKSYEHYVGRERD